MYFIINLFVDPDTKIPIEDPNATRFHLAEGSFQLPIYTNVEFKVPFTLASLQNFDVIPCVSVLVRLQKYTSEKDKNNYIEPIKYKSGTYTNNYIVMSLQQIEWLENLKAEPSKLIRDAIDNLKGMPSSSVFFNYNNRIPIV